MPKLILGFVGQAGCGKGTAADILREKYKAGYYRFSAILGDLLTRLSLEKTRDNLIKISEMVRQGFGEDVLSYAIQNDSVHAKEDIVVIDGIRRLEDIAALEPLPNFKLVAISVPAELRYERMKGRGEKADETTMTWEKFLENEQRSTEITIPAVMERASVTLSNAGTQEEFLSAVDGMMKHFGF
ncbi:hypothetical protein FJZ48_02530 [Candidatus Uhrbacteria bacterium]|nr:hypothetical protein [Candidatus Uhrbacteria bacterium]